MSEIVESRLIEIAIDSTQVHQQLDAIQKNLAESNTTFERLGQTGTAALSKIEGHFSSLTSEINAYTRALETAQQKLANFQAPSLGGRNSFDPFNDNPARSQQAANERKFLQTPPTEIDQTDEYLRWMEDMEAQRVRREMERAPARDSRGRFTKKYRPIGGGAAEEEVEAYYEKLYGFRGAADLLGSPYQSTLGGPFSPIPPTRTPNIGLGDPLIRSSQLPEFDDPFGIYGRGGSLKEKYQTQLDALRVRREAMEEIRKQQNIVDPQILARRQDAIDVFTAAQPDLEGLYTRQRNVPVGVSDSTDDFIQRLRGGRADASANADFSMNAEKLHDYANALKAAGQGADVYSDGTVKIRNASGQLQTVLGQSKKGMDELGGSTKGTGGIIGSLEYSMLRSFAVMGVMWGGINLLQQAMTQWITNTTEADYTMNLLGYTTARTRGEISQLTREAMTAAAGYGIGPQQSLPATLLASRASDDPAEILARVRGSAQTSMLTGQDQGKAMEDLISIQRKWNLEATETDRINNILAVAYKNTIVPLDQFSESLVRMSAFGRENNLTLEETAGLITGFVNATGISEPSRAETFFEVVGGIQKQPQNVELLRQQGFSIYNQEGGMLTTVQLIENIAAAWSKMGEEEQKSTVLGLVGRQRLNEGLDYFNAYADKATATMQAFNTTIGEGAKIDEARGKSLKQMWNEFWAGADAGLSDPNLMNELLGKGDTRERMTRITYKIPEQTPIPNSLIDMQDSPERQRTMQNWLDSLNLQETGIDQYRKQWSDASRMRGITTTPTISTGAQQVIDNYGTFQKLDMTGEQFDTRAAEATKQAYANIEEAAKQNAATESERAAIVSQINERMDQTVVLYSLQGGQVRSLRADVGALLEEQEKALRLPSLQASNLTGGELDAAINQARGLAAQYKLTVQQAGFSTKGLDDEWNKTSTAIRTSDGSIRVLTGSAAVFLNQALQIGRAIQTWRPPQLQISNLTQQQFQQQNQVANQLAADYIRNVQSSNLPLDAKKQILEQIKDNWQQEIQFTRLSNGQIVQATGATAAFAAQAGQVTAQWSRAAQAIQAATQIRPNIQTMPELNAQTAAQLQQYLIQYENLLRSMNVPQDPQQYMIFGQNGAIFQFITSADAMQLAMALLMESINYNTAATDDASSASNDLAKAQSDQLRGSYNLPTEWGYKPPTPWEYYDDAKRAGRQVPMGPVNYPWMFPDENGGGADPKSKLAKFLAQPHLGMVPTGTGGLLESTFGKEIKPAFDVSLLAANGDATRFNTDATRANTDAMKLLEQALAEMSKAEGGTSFVEKTGQDFMNRLAANWLGPLLGKNQGDASFVNKIGQTFMDRIASGWLGLLQTKNPPHNAPPAPYSSSGSQKKFDETLLKPGDTLNINGIPQITTSINTTATNTQTMATQLPTIMTSVNTNTSAIATRVPAGLGTISANLVGGNLLMTQMLSYLSIISRQIAKPPQVNVTVEPRTDFVESPVRRPLSADTTGGTRGVVS